MYPGHIKVPQVTRLLWKCFRSLALTSPSLGLWFDHADGMQCTQSVAQGRVSIPGT